MIKRIETWVMSRECSRFAATRAMVYLGKRLFSFVAVYSPPPDHKEATAVHFAASEREFNDSVRTYTEGLDASYKE